MTQPEHNPFGFVGLTYEDAQQKASDVGLEVARKEFKPSTEPDGTVLEQNPASGALVLDETASPLDTPIAGTETGKEFFRVIIRGEKDDLDIALAEADIIDAGRRLVAASPDVGAIVLECTNMPPYAAALREAVGLPVYDIYSMVNWFYAGLRPRRFR